MKSDLEELQKLSHSFTNNFEGWMLNQDERIKISSSLAFGPDYLNLFNKLNNIFLENDLEVIE